MKQRSIVILICALFLIAPNIQAADDIIIKLPFAFQDRFQEGSQQLGFPEGNVLQVGCLIKSADSPIKEVTAKNLDTGLVLTPTPLNVGNAWSGLYLVFPMPTFDPQNHMGEWEISVKDEKGNEATVKTHKLNINAEMPFVKRIKASGNPIAPLISWSPPDEKYVHKNCSVRYEIRLVTDIKNQFHKSKTVSQTQYQVPEGLIKPEDLSKVYIRIDTQGYDKTDSLHPLPLEQKSQTFISLREALDKS